MIFTSNSPTETEQTGYQFAEKLYTGGIRKAFIAMKGEMGVGKTAFTRGFASYFGIKSVKSPTYTIVNEYGSDKVKIYHFDMYRIESEDDLYSIGFYDYIDTDSYCIAEWSENILELCPDLEYFTVSIRCVPDDEEKRIIEISYPQD